MEDIGKIFSAKTDNDNPMGGIWSEHNLHGNSNHNHVLGHFRHNYLYHLLHLYKEMPQLPLAIKGLIFMGWFITGWGILLDTPLGQQIFDTMPLGFKYSIWFFTSAFLMLNCLRAYERYRKDKIQNDDAEILLKEKKDAYNIAHSKIKK